MYTMSDVRSASDVRCVGRPKQDGRPIILQTLCKGRNPSAQWCVGRPKCYGRPKCRTSETGRTSEVFAKALYMKSAPLVVYVGRPKYNGRPKLSDVGRPKYVGRPKAGQWKD